MRREPIRVFDREAGHLVEEKIEGELFLRMMYEKHPNLLAPIRKALCGNSLFSRFAGFMQRTKFSGRKIDRFIKYHRLDVETFEKTDFKSFDEFFTRKLKKEARPIAIADVIMPADGRYLGYENFSEEQEIIVKGGKLSLHKLLGGDDALTERYLHGSLVIARLAPPDYHRFHSPVSGMPSEAIEIGGAYYSVNPLALRYNLDYLTQNKRSIIQIKTTHVGDVLFIPVGATCVGSIHYTYQPGRQIQIGDEMGFFSFGGSTVIMIFEPEKVKLADDLVEQSGNGRELLAKTGTPLADKIKS